VFALPDDANKFDLVEPNTKTTGQTLCFYQNLRRNFSEQLYCHKERSISIHKEILTLTETMGTLTSSTTPLNFEVAEKQDRTSVLKEALEELQDVVCFHNQNLMVYYAACHADCHRLRYVIVKLVHSADSGKTGFAIVSVNPVLPGHKV